MAVTRFRPSRDRIQSWRLPHEGESMAEATLAEISPVRTDLGIFVARAARLYGPKPALVAGGRT